MNCSWLIAFHVFIYLPTFQNEKGSDPWLSLDAFISYHLSKKSKLSKNLTFMISFSLGNKSMKNL